MVRSDQLTQDEERALRLAVQGKTQEEIGQELGIKKIRDTFSRIRRKLGARNFHHATALYANVMGQRGEYIYESPEVEPEFEAEGILVLRGTGFHIGRLRHPACVVSSALRLPNEVKCIVSDERYDAPPEFRDRLDELRGNVVKQAQERGEIAYERPGGGLLAVNRLDAVTEFYRPLSLTLRQVGYFTVKAVRDNLTPELKTKYPVNPFHVVDAVLPLPLAVCLQIIAGQPPHLIACKRPPNLGTYSGVYSGAVQALGEADNDVAILEGEKIFDPVSAMMRELGEERSLLAQGMQRTRFREAVQLLGLVFDYRVLTYILMGYVWIPRVRPEAIIKSMSDAKEGTYEALPFPDPSASSYSQHEILRSLCEHLTNYPWAPCCSIGIVNLLDRLGYRKSTVYPLLGEPVESV